MSRYLALIVVALCSPAAAGEALPVAVPAAPEPKALSLGASYVIDLSFASSSRGGARRLDRFDLTGEANLGRVGCGSCRAFVRLLGNSGGKPNDGAGTLQGINNIEVPKDGLRLFEAWVERDIGRGSVRAGAYDLNSEFYATEGSALLLAPAFGIGSELAATGPNGPSIFPYSALAVRGEARLGRTGLIRAAVVNAAAGTLTDRGGVDFSLRDGVLAIVEGGSAGSGGKLVAGLWSYSRRQPVRDEATDGRRRAMGAYLLGERKIGEWTTAFVRAGVSDGRTSSFKGGWQAGVHRSPAWFGSKDSEVALGLSQAFLSGGERRSIAAGGERPAVSEAGVELSFRDRLFGPVTVQPSLQLVRHPGGLADAQPLLIGTVRFGWSL
ncbi:carbohydrate porin [Sphingomonas humi]